MRRSDPVQEFLDGVLVPEYQAKLRRYLVGRGRRFDFGRLFASGHARTGNAREECAGNQQGLNRRPTEDTTFHVDDADGAASPVKLGEIVSRGLKTVSVVVVHTGSVAQLRQCLLALSYQNYPETFLEVIVVGNSDDKAGALAQLEFPFIKLECELKTESAPAKNKGAAVAEGQMIAFLHSDCRPDENWIAKAMATAETQDFESVIACNVRPDVTKTRSVAVQWYEAIRSCCKRQYVKGSQACSATGMIVPRNIWIRVGLFDNIAEAGCEDDEWFARASRRGVRFTYAPEAIVTQSLNRSWAELKRKSEGLARGELRLYVATKHGNKRVLRFRALRNSYTMRWLCELAAVIRDQTVPWRHRFGVATAATLVWFWSLAETKRCLRAQLRLRAQSRIARRNKSDRSLRPPGAKEGRRAAAWPSPEKPRYV
jgi:GT2 family glycosyltransferase